MYQWQLGILNGSKSLHCKALAALHIKALSLEPGHGSVYTLTLLDCWMSVKVLVSLLIVQGEHQHIRTQQRRDCWHAYIACSTPNLSNGIMNWLQANHVTRAITQEAL